MDLLEGPLPTLSLPPPSITTSSLEIEPLLSKKRKVSANAGPPVEKRVKRMGRPKNGWTATRKRKLIRLYLMTELDVLEIAQVLRAETFQPWFVLILLNLLPSDNAPFPLTLLQQERHPKTTHYPPTESSKSSPFERLNHEDEASTMEGM